MRGRQVGDGGHHGLLPLTAPPPCAARAKDSGWAIEVLPQCVPTWHVGSVRSDSVTSAKVDAIAHALAGEQATEDRLTSAADFTRAQLELRRIRSIRAELLAKIDSKDNNLQELRREAALDRYER